MSGLRDEVLGAFRVLTGLPIASVARAGADRASMLYTLTLDDGCTLRVDDKTLWSPTEFLRAATVGYGRHVESVKAAAWQPSVQALLIHATDVLDTPGETYADAVLDWLRAYTERASTDRDGAAAAGQPFIYDGHLHVKADRLAIFIRRELVEQVNRTELYQALRDLGFERRAINYVRGKRNTSERSTASYYRAPLSVLDADIGEA